MFPARQGAKGAGGAGGAARAAVIQPSLLEVQLSVLPIQQVRLLTGPPSCHVRQLGSWQHWARQRSSVYGSLCPLRCLWMSPTFVKPLQRPIFSGKFQAAQ